MERPTLDLRVEVERPMLALVSTHEEPAFVLVEWGTPPDCRPGSTARGRECVPDVFCPTGFARNKRTGWCDPTNRAEYFCNPDEEKPFCGPDRYYDRSKGECVPCPCQLSKGFVVGPRGDCVFRRAGQPCCPGQDPTMPCVSDRVWDEKGECIGREIPLCKTLFGPLAFYDPDLKECACPSGYVRDDGLKSCRRETEVPEVQFEDEPEPLIASPGALFAGVLAGVALEWLWERYAKT